MPKFIASLLERLEAAGYEAYPVGGAVRDILLGENPQAIDNWDIAASAAPEEVLKIFSKDCKTFYENKFGTVTVLERNGKQKILAEITPFRKESGYSNGRHPDSVQWTKSLKQDLSRRDFTINAMALAGQRIVDPFGGQKDLAAKLVRAVGNPDDRFSEDALRMMRAVRFACQLHFEIEEKTFASIKKNAPRIEKISKERIRDEFVKIILSQWPMEGIKLLHTSGLLRHIMPELEAGIKIKQVGQHRHDVFTHSILTLKFAAENGASLELRLAALLHDIGKPPTAGKKNGRNTFYGHNVVGEKITREVLRRLKFPKNIIEKVSTLVRYHMFYYEVDKVTESSVRRLLRRVGKENFPELIALRIADRRATPVPKAKPYRLRHLEYMAEKVSQDPLSTSQLKVNGRDVMRILKIEPGPKVGLVLKALLAEILDNPEKNKKPILEKMIEEFGKLEETELAKKLTRIDRELYEKEKLLKEKHFVR